MTLERPQTSCVVTHKGKFRGCSVSPFKGWKIVANGELNRSKFQVYICWIPLIGAQGKNKIGYHFCIAIELFNDVVRADTHAGIWVLTQPWFLCFMPITSSISIVNTFGLSHQLKTKVSLQCAKLLVSGLVRHLQFVRAFNIACIKTSHFLIYDESCIICWINFDCKTHYR